MADAEEEGFVKIHIKEGTDRILGATVVARHAGELIGVISLAISTGIGIGKLAHVSFPYPTQAAAIKMASNAHQDRQHSRFRAWWLRKWLAL